MKSFQIIVQLWGKLNWEVLGHKIKQNKSHLNQPRQYKADCFFRFNSISDTLCSFFSTLNWMGFQFWEKNVQARGKASSNICFRNLWSSKKPGPSCCSLHSVAGCAILILLVWSILCAGLVWSSAFLSCSNSIIWMDWWTGWILLVLFRIAENRPLQASSLLDANANFELTPALSFQ